MPEVVEIPVSASPTIKKTKTRIRKDFRWGFLLSETDLRRIVRSCTDSVAKISGIELKERVEVILKDGSLLNFDNIDDALAVENSGRKSVQQLSISYFDRDDNADNADWTINIHFQDGEANRKSWTSVELEVF